MKHQYTKNDLEIVTQEEMYRGYFRLSKFTLKHKLFSGETSSVITRELFQRGQSVAVLLYDPKRDRIVLSEQFRIGSLDDKTSPWLFEIVAGVMDNHGESPEDVAIREAKEETGSIITKIEPVFQYWVSPGGTSEYMHLYVGQVDAEHAGGVHGLDHEDEDIRVFTVSREEAIALLEAGQLNNSVAIIAIQWLALHYQELQKRWNVA